MFVCINEPNILDEYRTKCINIKVYIGVDKDLRKSSTE